MKKGKQIDSLLVSVKILSICPNYPSNRMDNPVLEIFDKSDEIELDKNLSEFKGPEKNIGTIW